MRVEIERVAERRLEVVARGARLVVDRTVEEGGAGDGFRSGELLMAALGSCMVGTMLGFAESRGIEVGDVQVVLTDEVAEAPKRITTVRVEMRLGADLPPEQVESLRRVASRCKIHNTLADPPTVELAITAGRRPRDGDVPPLVSGEWLEDRLGDPRVRVLEISSSRPEEAPYGAGHVPGSTYVYWKDLCWDEASREFPAPEEMSRRLGRLGVGEGDVLVLVGDPIQFATYAYWVLTMTGFGRRATVLDGGRRAWEGAGRPMTRDVPEVRPVEGPAPGDPDASSRMGRDQVRAGLSDPGRVLLDLRSPEEYRGERVSPITAPIDHGAERAGRIPGARHLYYERLLRPDGTFRPREEILTALAEVGASEGSELVTYCRLSHRASLGWFALTRLAGRDDVKVYDGSWTEWGSMVGMPVER